MDLRNNENDRPYRGVNRAQYTPPEEQNDYADYDDSMTTQAYYRERLRGMTQQRWFPLAAVTLGVILFGGLVAFAYHQGADTTANSTTPLIQAENGDYKTKPQDPGGMDVPFQDAVVFDQIDKSKVADAGGKVENLLPPPEQPVDAPNKSAATQPASPAPEAQLPSAPKAAVDKGVVAENEDGDSVADKIAATETNLKTKTSTATDVVTATKIAQAATIAAAPTLAKAATNVTPTEQTATATQTAAPVKIAMVKTETVKTVAKVTPVETTKTTAIKTASKMNAVAPAAATPAPAHSTGLAKVQLGAFKDEAAAKAAWASLQKQFTPHLNGVTPNYARADLGAKGVFYRVQGVNLSSAQAHEICTAINATKPGACIIPQ